jgi:NitT/TauT family transport system ATP-binding protein
VADGVIDVDVRSKSYGSVEVLRNVRFRIAAGETLALLGPSGVGKSTLLRIVAGIDREFEGNIQRRRRLAMVFQEPTLLEWRSALDNIRLVHPNLGAEAAMEALREVGLGDKGRLFPRQLSLGQQRRLALARGFAGRPEFLIMDEPFVSLDAETADDMLRLTERLIDLVRPATLFVTHSRQEAERLADRILILAGSPASLQPTLQKELT